MQSDASFNIGCITVMHLIVANLKFLMNKEIIFSNFIDY